MNELTVVHMVNMENFSLVAVTGLTALGGLNTWAVVFVLVWMVVKMFWPGPRKLIKHYKASLQPETARTSSAESLSE